ncbi:MAG: sulfotransferase [Actinomycetota bacterium]
MTTPSARTGRPPNPSARRRPSAPSSIDGRLKVLFIGGLGRSGSTLVELLLNEMGPAVSVGETIHLWERGVANNERCACGRNFDRCPHWSAVGEKAFGGWDRIDLDDVISLRWSVDRSRRLPAIARRHRQGGPSDDERRYLEHLRLVLQASAAVTGGPELLLESSKHLSTAALLALDDAIDLRVLHLVRDPRGVAYSWTKEVERPETATDGGPGELMPIYRPHRTALRWVTDNLGFDALSTRVPTLRLRYEDVLARPVASLSAIAGLCDLDPTGIDLGFLDGDRATVSAPMHSVAGNPMRFGGREVTLRLDDAWRRELDPAKRRLVTAMTGTLLAAYGYDLR